MKRSIGTSMNIKLHILNEISIIESAGAYLETALDHYGFPVSRLQGQREQDICRANRELQVPTPNVPPGMNRMTPLLSYKGF